jgi:hypothetical protein
MKDGLEDGEPLGRFCDGLADFGGAQEVAKFGDALGAIFDLLNH